MWYIIGLIFKVAKLLLRSNKVGKKSLIALLASIGLVLVVVLSGCGPASTAPSTPSTPSKPGGGGKATGIEVVFVDVEPAKVIVGETANITAEVKNYGTSQATYTAKLTVDGADVQTKDITLAGGDKGTITFSLVENTPGTYTVAVGGMISVVVVNEKPAPGGPPEGGGGEG
jgi:hypothetical protein